MPATTAVAANAAGLARGNSGGGARGASAGSRITHHASLLALNFVLASSQSVGGAGGGLDFHFCGEFFPARPVAPHGGEIRAAVAGGDGGIKKTAADVCGTGRLA